MDPVQLIAQSFGDVINGVLQVVVSFLNVIIDVLPNPDPFPTIIESLDSSTVTNMGFAVYWLDAFCGINTCVTIINLWLALMINAGIFALVYWVVKSIRG